MLELLCYFVTAIGAVTLIARLREQDLRARLKVAALEFEHGLAIDNAKQVRHDVAAPLGALRMIVHASKSLDPQIHAILSNAINRTEQIFNRLEIQNQPSCEPTCVETALKEVMLEKKAVWGAKCDLKLVAHSGVGLIWANPGELKSVLSNLLNNAFEAHDKVRPRVEISLARESDNLTISIRDSGKGMSDEVLRSIGNKGFTHGKDALTESGSGLGVYGATRAVKNWGGSLTYRSKPGEGTEARLQLSVANA